MLRHPRKREFSTVSLTASGQLVPHYRGARRCGRPRPGEGDVADDSRRYQVEEELRRSNGELHRFASAASLDLQEPAWTIVSFSQLLDPRCRGQPSPGAGGASRSSSPVASESSRFWMGTASSPTRTARFSQYRDPGIPVKALRGAGPARRTGTAIPCSRRQSTAPGKSVLGRG